MDPMKEIGAGTLAGIAQVAVGHPFDTVKVRLQCQRPNDIVFNGTLDCAQKTFRHEGIRGLYKGAWSPLVGAMFQNAAGFFFFASSKQIVRSCYRLEDAAKLDKAQTFIAAGLSACMALFVETPVDLLKVKMQSQIHGRSGQYRNVFHAGYKILQERGVPGLFQGFVSNGWRFVPGRAVYFSAYDSALGYLNGRSNSSRSSSPGESLKSSRPPPPPLYHCFLAGGFAGGVAWLSTYPFDVIRNRMQADAADPRLRKYRNMWHCAYEIAAQEGFHGYFKGLTVCLIRAIPVIILWICRSNIDFFFSSPFA